MALDPQVEAFFDQQLGVAGSNHEARRRTEDRYGDLSELFGEAAVAEMTTTPAHSDPESTDSHSDTSIDGLSAARAAGVDIEHNRASRDAAGLSESGRIALEAARQEKRARGESPFYT